MYKSIIWTGMMGLMCACLPDIGAGKDSSITEEPSSEPAEEPSDSADGDSGVSDDSGSTDDSDDTSSEPSNEPSDDHTDDGVGYLNPDILLFSFRNGYADACTV